MGNNYDLLFYPNSFNTATNLSFQLIEDASGTLKVLNIQGELVNELIVEAVPNGYYQYGWDGKNDRGQPLASGIYLVALMANSPLEQDSHFLCSRLVLIK